MARRLGETQDQYEARREEQGDKVYIKYFKEGETKLRAREPVKAWTRYRYHFDPTTNDSYACIRDVAGPGERCVGCASPRERERSAATGYVFNALDDQGRPQMYRTNIKVHDDVAGREKRAQGRNDGKGDVRDYDLIIIREGKGKDNTTYLVETGDTYEIPEKFTSQEMFDIPGLLGAQYDEAAAARQGYFDAADEGSQDTDPWKDGKSEDKPAAKSSSGRIGGDDADAKPTAKTSTKKAEPKAEPKEEEQGDVPAEASVPERLTDSQVADLLPTVSIEKDGGKVEFDAMENADLRTWIDKHGGKVALSAGRGVLIHEVKERLALGEPVF